MKKQTGFHDFPASPPRLSGPPLIGLKCIARPLWKAAQIYLESMRTMGHPYPGWEGFEHDLAFRFAFLLVSLGSMRQENSRRELLEGFLQVLAFERARGRRPVAPSKLRVLVRGRLMKELWDKELQHAWNIKTSLEGQGKSAREALDRRARNGEIKPDVAGAVIVAKSTPRSVVARLYARRNNMSFGTARNALRAYEKGKGEFCPHTI